MKINLFFLICISACILIINSYSCSPARFVKPLNKNQQSANISLGGPLITYGNSVIPVPFLTANYGYGIDSSLTGFGSVNITSALFANLQMELGAAKQLCRQHTYLPALTITPALNIIYRNKDAHKLYPQLTVNAFWEYGKRKNFFYIGIDNWFELSQKRAFDIIQPNHWIFMPEAGHNFTLKKWNFIIETKVIAPNLSNQNLVVDYQTPFKSHGALGVYFGLTRKF